MARAQADAWIKGQKDKRKATVTPSAGAKATDYSALPKELQNRAKARDAAVQRVNRLSQDKQEREQQKQQAATYAAWQAESKRRKDVLESHWSRQGKQAPQSKWDIAQEYYDKNMTGETYQQRVQDAYRKATDPVLTKQEQAAVGKSGIETAKRIQNMKTFSDSLNLPTASGDAVKRFAGLGQAPKGLELDPVQQYAEQYKRMAASRGKATSPDDYSGEALRTAADSRGKSGSQSAQSDAAGMRVRADELDQKSQVPTTGYTDQQIATAEKTYTDAKQSAGIYRRWQELLTKSQSGQIMTAGERNQLSELEQYAGVRGVKTPQEGLSKTDAQMANEVRIMGYDPGTADIDGLEAKYADQSEDKLKQEWYDGLKDAKSAKTEQETAREKLDRIGRIQGVLAKQQSGAVVPKDDQILLSEAEMEARAYGMTVQQYISSQRSTLEETIGKAKETRAKYDKAGTYGIGYESIMDERAAKWNGQISQLEQNADMLGTANAGAWIREWNDQYDQAKDELAQLKADYNNLKMAGNSPEAEKTAKDKLDIAQRHVTELLDMSAMAQPDFGSQGTYNPQFARQDETYLAVNADEKQIKALLPSEHIRREQNTLKYSFLSDTEKQIYNYYYDKYGKNRAENYLKAIDNRITARQAQQDTASWEETSKRMPALATVASVAGMPGEMLGLGAALWGGLTGQEVNPNGSDFAATRMRQTVRGTVKENIKSPVGQFAYDVGTSMGDMAIASFLGGGSSAASSLFMSGASGAATAYDTLMRGGASSDAAFAGGVSALTEYITEHMGFDAITKGFHTGQGAGAYKDIIKTFVKGFIPEGLEEVPGNFVDQWTDDWLMGKNSKRAIEISKYMQQGMSLDDAITEADKAFVADTVMSFLAGGMAGGLAEGGAFAAGVVSGKLDAKTQAASLAADLPGVDEQTVRQAMEMEQGIRPLNQSIMDAANQQITQAVEARQEQEAKHTPFEAAAETGGGKTVVKGLASVGQDAKVVLEDGKTAALSEVTIDNADTQAAYGYAAAYPDTDTGRKFLAGYEASTLPLNVYRQGFEAAYAQGYSGVEPVGQGKVYAGMLGDTVQSIALQAGKDASALQDARVNMDTAMAGSIAQTIEHLPNVAEDGYTGAVMQADKAKMNSTQQAYVATLDYLGKKWGVTYTVIDSFGDGATQGKYVPGSTSMYVALDADEGLLTRVASHESWHYVKEWNGDSAAELEGFVLDKLKATEGYDLESRITEKIEQYKKAGQELTRDDAVEEIVADSLLDVLGSEANVKEVVENHRTLAQKLIGLVQRVVKEIRDALHRLGRKNPEVRAMLQQDVDTLRDIAGRFDRLMTETYAKRLAGVATAETQANAEAWGKRSIKEPDIDLKYDYEKDGRDLPKEDKAILDKVFQYGNFELIGEDSDLMSEIEQNERINFRGGSEMSEWGHGMYAKDPEELYDNHYGEGRGRRDAWSQWVVDTRGQPTIQELHEELMQRIAEWREGFDDDTPDMPYYLEEVSDEEIAETFDPENIIDDAGAFDK